MGISIYAEGGDVWQWDLGRTVRAEPHEPGDLMDFALRGSCRCWATAEDGQGAYPVPNGLLKAGRDLVCMLHRGGETVAARCIRVSPRPMPADYVYSETPTVGYAQLRAEVMDAIEGLSQRIDAVSPGQAISFGSGPPPDGLGASMYIDTDTYDVYASERI